MQLKILYALEKHIGLGIPIQEFFDLIVGTRYEDTLEISPNIFELTVFYCSGGGIVALGLGTKRLSVTDCADLFKKFAREAFTERRGVGWPAYGTLVEARHHSRYVTRGIQNALKDAFGERILFGGKKAAEGQPALRVAVTTTSSNGTPYLLANYSRPMADSCMTFPSTAPSA